MALPPDVRMVYKVYDIPRVFPLLLMELRPSILSSTKIYGFPFLLIDMKMQSRLIGPCSDKVVSPDLIEIHVAALAQRLVLFDTFILKSVRLREVPSLLGIFGFEGLINLLKSGALKIECGTLSAAETGNLKLHRPHPLPLGSFSFSVAALGDYKQSISQRFASIRPYTSLPQKSFIKLKRAIADNLLLPPESGGNDALRQLYKDVETNSPLIQSLVVKSLATRHGRTASPDDVYLRMHRVDDNVFESETNLGEQFQLKPLEVDQLIEAAILALGSLNIRIEEMKIYNALSGFTEEEMPIFGEKMNFLMEALLPNNLEQQMQRIGKIQGFPDISISDGQRIDADKLIEIRNTSECREFRQWIQSLGAASDKEIEERLNSLRSKIGNALTGRTAKVIRFLIPAIVGVIPGAGTVASLILDSIDSFLIDRFYPSDGPVSFISDLYPSIFPQD